MTSQDSFKSYQTKPVTGKEPVLLHDLPQDKIVSALVTLAAELYMVRDRVHVLEAELEKHDLLPPDAVDNHEDTADEQAARAKDAQAFADRFWLQLIKPDTPVSAIDPAVEKYLEN